MDSIQETARQPRLNPFVFASDTSLRFILLILSVLGAALWIYNSPLLYTTGDSVKQVEAQFQCITGSGADTALKAVVSYQPQAFSQFNAAHNFYQQCMTPFYLQNVMHMGVGVIVLFIITGVIYLVLPVWIRKRKRLVPLPLAQMPELAMELSDLCQEAGLARQPQFVWNPLNPLSEGFAFGHQGCYWVAVGGGLIKLFSKNRETFRAVLRHELAHLSNADIDKTYLSVAIWWAFILTALVPVAYYQIINTTSGNLLANLLFDVNLLGHVVALAILVWLTRNAVLRSRELYADVRASTVDGLSGGLHRLLAHATHTERKVRWLALSVHPDARTRYTVMNDTSLLFRSSFWTSFNAGIAATVAFDGNFVFFTSLGNLLQVAVFALFVAGLLLGGLTIGVVGSILWRTIFAARMEGKKQYGIGRIAGGTVLGCAFGMILSFSLFAAQTAFSLTTLVASLLNWGLCSLLLLGTLWLLLRWLVMVATTWLPVTTSQTMLRRSSFFSLMVAGTIWAVLFGALLYIGEATMAFADIGLLIAFLGLVFLLAQPLVVVGLILVWAVPLVASFWYKRAVRANTMNWAFLDVPAPQISLTPDQPFRLRFTLVLGVLGTLLFCSIILFLKTFFHLSLPQASQNSLSFRISFIYGCTGLSTLFQAGIATIAVLRVQHMRVAHALCAAFIGGCLMALGILSIHLMFGGKEDILFIQSIFFLIINGGTTLALLSALCVSALTKWSSRTLPQTQTFSVRLAIAAGLFSILAFCEILFVSSQAIGQTASLVRMFGLKGDFAALQVKLEQLGPQIYATQMMIAIIFEVAVAVFATVRARRHPILQGFLAALISASGTFFGMVIILLLNRQTSGVPSLWVETFWVIIVIGLSLSFSIIVFISLLTRKGQQVLPSPIRLALRNGLIGNLPVCIFILMITTLLALFGQKLLFDINFKSSLYVILIALAILFQVGMTTLMTWRARRWSFFCALLSAVSGSCVIGIGINVSFLLLTGKVSLGILPLFIYTFLLVIVGGTMLSLPVAFVFFLLTQLVRRARRSGIERVKTTPLT